MASRDIAHLSQHSLALLPKRQQRELRAQIEKIAALNALAEAAASEQAASLRDFAATLGDAIDEIEERLAPLDRLTASQREELESQIDLVLLHNRQLLDEAQAYALSLMRDMANRDSPVRRSSFERFMAGFTGSEENWDDLKRVLGG